MKAITTLVAALLCVACAAPAVRYVSPSGRNAAALPDDLAACQADAAVVRGEDERELLVQHCMGDLGYGMERSGG